MSLSTKRLSWHWRKATWCTDKRLLYGLMVESMAASEVAMLSTIAQRPGLTREEIAGTLAMARYNAYVVLARLHSWGVVRQAGKGWYAIQGEGGEKEEEEREE